MDCGPDLRELGPEPAGDGGVAQEVAEGDGAGHGDAGVDDEDEGEDGEQECGVAVLGSLTGHTMHLADLSLAVQCPPPII